MKVLHLVMTIFGCVVAFGIGLPSLILYKASKGLKASRASTPDFGGLRALRDDEEHETAPVQNSDKGLFPQSAQRDRNVPMRPAKAEGGRTRRSSLYVLKESIFSALASLFDSREWDKNNMRPSKTVKGPVSSEGMPPFKKARRASEWVKEGDRPHPSKRTAGPKEKEQT